jgi:hypothetical protein
MLITRHGKLINIAFTITYASKYIFMHIHYRTQSSSSTAYPRGYAVGRRPRRASCGRDTGRKNTRCVVEARTGFCLVRAFKNVCELFCLLTHTVNLLLCCCTTDCRSLPQLTSSTLIESSALHGNKGFISLCTSSSRVEHSILWLIRFLVNARRSANKE